MDSSISGPRASDTRVPVLAQSREPIRDKLRGTRRYRRRKISPQADAQTQILLARKRQARAQACGAHEARRRRKFCSRLRAPRGHQRQRDKLPEGSNWQRTRKGSASKIRRVTARQKHLVQERTVQSVTASSREDALAPWCSPGPSPSEHGRNCTRSSRRTRRCET
jgi:hypothetical protein